MPKGCVLGHSNQVLGTTVVPTVETLIGRQFAGTRQNQDIVAGSGVAGAITEVGLGHKVQYRSIQATAGSLFTDITAGTYDANLTTTINAVLARPDLWNTANPFYVAFHHEIALPANDVFYTGGVYAPQQYIDAHRHVVDLFDSLGATMFSKTGKYLGGPFIFCYVGWNRMFDNTPVDTHTAGRGIDDLDPDKGSSPAPTGTTYYTLLGSDPYNDNTPPLKYGTDASIMLAPIAAAAKARGKNWMLGEGACGDGGTSQDHLNKAAWYDSARAFIAAQGNSNTGRCIAWFTTIKGDASLYNVDTSAESTAAWQRLAADPYFQETRLATHAARNKFDDQASKHGLMVTGQVLTKNQLEHLLRIMDTTGCTLTVPVASLTITPV